jgi:hypothetical protein
MKKTTLRLLLLVALCMMLFDGSAKAAGGFYIGPSFTIYPETGGVSHSFDPGFGLQAGFLFRKTNCRTVTFRFDLAFSYTRSYATITMDPYENNATERIQGDFNFYRILLNPQVQVNVLPKTGGLFISTGLCPWFGTTTGKGTATSMFDSTSEFSGGRFSNVFMPVGIAATVNLGFQHIRAGSVILFAEVRASYDLSPVTNYHAYAANKTVTMGVSFGIFL